MGNQKQTFAKLTEDLEKLDNEPVVKSAEEPKEEPKDKDKEPEVKIAEVTPPVEPVAVVEPVAEPEPEVEEEEVEKSKKDDKDKDPKAKEKDKAAAKGKDDKDEKDPDGDEDDKVKKSEDEKDKKDDKKGKCSDCGKAKADCTCDDKKVKKSAEVEAISEADIVGAFEAVVKSFGGLKSDVRTELTEIKKSIADLFELVKPAAPAVEEPVAKSAEPVAEEPKAEPEAEPVAKSVDPEPEPEPEGKAVQYISKSNGIPEGVQPEGEPEGEPEEFNAMDHVKDVTDYFMKNASQLTEGEKFALRGAVNRVKRGEGTDADVEIFRQLSQI